MSHAKRPAPRLSFRWADPKTGDQRDRYYSCRALHYFDKPVSPERDPVMAAAQAALPGEMLAVRAPRRAAPRSRAAALAALDRAGEAALSAEPDCSLLHRSPGNTRLTPRYAYDVVDVEIWIDSGRMPSEWTVAEQAGYRMPPLWASARVVPLLTAAPVRMPDEIEESEEQAA